MKDFDIPDFDLDFLVDTAKEQGKKQVTNFFKQIGANMGVLIGGGIGLFFMGESIPEASIIKTLWLAQILIFVAAVYFIYEYLNRDNKEMRFNFQIMSQTLVKFQDHNYRFQRRMIGTVDALESHTELAIFERDLDTALVVSMNDNWERIFGWDIDEINHVMEAAGTDLMKRNVAFSKAFVAKESNEKMLQSMKDVMIKKSREPRIHKNVVLQRRDGSQLYANLAVAIVRDNGHYFAKIFITDLSEIRHKEAVIESLVYLVKQIDEHFGKNTDKNKGRQRFLNELKKFGDQIKDGLDQRR